jgi:hypothetical protein
MDRVDLTTTMWFKSSHSNGQQACVEAGAGPTGVVPVRDSKDPHGPALVFQASAWRAFVTGIRAEERTSDF